MEPGGADAADERQDKRDGDDVDGFFGEKQ
jgi:hypothetical protein